MLLTDASVEEEKLQKPTWFYSITAKILKNFL
jgi:hypothetical protein